MTKKATDAPWLPRDKLKLEAMRANGHTTSEIARVLNRSQGSILSMATVLALPRPALRRTSSIAQLRTSELGKPLDLGEGDQRYVDAVLRAGAFASMARLNDGRVIFGHAGKSWVRP